MKGRGLGSSGGAAPAETTQRRPPALTALLVTLAIAVMSFIGSAFYSQRFASRVDEDAVSIATNATPAIEHLTAARSEILRMQVGASQLIDEAEARLPPDRSLFERSERRLHEHLSQYLALRFYPGERIYYTSVKEEVGVLESQASLLMQRLDNADLAAAHRIRSYGLARASERADQAVGELVAFNAAQQHQLGLNIVERRRDATKLLYVLDTVTASLALVLLLLVFRVGKQHFDLHMRKRAAENQASELGRFNRKLQGLAEAAVDISAAIAFANRQDGWPPMLQTIVEQARRVTGAEYAALACRLDEPRAIRARATAGRDPEAPTAPEELVASAGQPPGSQKNLPAQTQAHAGAFLEVPLEHDGIVNGHLHLARSAEAGPFTDQDRHTAALLTAHAAVAIENVRLYHAVSRERFRLQLLADASARMAGSLEFSQTLEAVPQAAVPAFADVCLVDLMDLQGSADELRRVAVAAKNPGQEGILLELGERYPPHLGNPEHPFVRAIESRGPVLVDGPFESIFSEIARAPEHLELLRQLECRSLLVVPLAARDRTFGVCAFFHEDPTRFCAEDVALAEELARRAALSIDNARLYAEAERAIRAREELLAVVSHDLRNPLTAIKMNGSLLRDLLRGASDPARSAVERVIRATDRMNGMIADLLEAAQIEAGSLSLRRSPEPVPSMIGEAIDFFSVVAAEKSLHLEAHLPPLLLPVMCERERILRVLSNLIGNAVKFTPAGGAIAVSAEQLVGEVRVSVRDTGPGISADEIAHLFDRYWQPQDDRRGVGLGLYIAKGIVETHGGRIGVQSTVGGGATFWFTVPAETPAFETHAEA